MMNPVEYNEQYYLDKLPAQQKIIENTPVHNETFENKQLDGLRKTIRYTKIASIALSALSTVMLVSNIFLIVAHGFKNFALSSVTSISKKDWITQNHWIATFYKGNGSKGSWHWTLLDNFSEISSGYQKVFAIAMPLISFSAMFAVSTAIGIATLGIFLANTALDHQLEKKKINVEKQMKYFGQRRSIYQMLQNLKSNGLKISDVVKYRLLPKGSTSREYALFELMAIEYIKPQSYIEKNFLEGLYLKLNKSEAK